MMGAYSTEKGYIFEGKEIKKKRVKNVYMVCLFYHSRRLTKKYQIKKCN